MRIEQHPTDPIAPPVTDRFIRWPDHVTETPAVATRLPSSSPPRTRADDLPPIPNAGDLWDLAHPDPVVIAPPMMIRTPLARPARTGSPWASASLAVALVSIPLILLAGLGAILGVVSVILGVGGIVQIARDPERYRGYGRAVSALMIGTGTAIVGTPFLALGLFLLSI